MKVKKYHDAFEDKVTGRLKTSWYKFLFFLRRGQKEYCRDCLPSRNYYPYRLLNTGRAQIKEVGECKHK